jgi:hypothetical protein
MMMARAILASLVVFIGAAGGAAMSQQSAPPAQTMVARDDPGSAPKGAALKSPADFAAIGNQTERSRAMFAEIGRVLTHPRCMGCHPAGDHPLQGADMHEHRPPVARGDDAGRLGTRCAECHTEQNVTLHETASYKSIPGHPRWGLAPLSMAWQDKSLREICLQLKDTERNGGRDLKLLQEHVATDDLVAWGWTPGPGRVPAP